MNPTSSLSEEEQKELESLESEFAKEAEAAAVAREKQHLEAMRLRKKFSANGTKKHGTDFAVVETNIGNFVIRKPKDTEIDAVADDEGRSSADDRAAGEAFVAGIMLHPTTAEVQAMFTDHPGLAGSIAPVAIELAAVKKRVEAKK